MHALTCLLALNGLRLTETLDARLEHLEQVAGHPTLWLPARKQGASDRVALPQRTVDAIATARKTRTTGRILLSGGRRLTQASVYTAFDRLTEIAGVGFQVRPHMLRATYVTLSLEAGIQARDVVNSAGWASYAMLAYYDRGYSSVARSPAIPLAELVAAARQDTSSAE